MASKYHDTCGKASAMKGSAKMPMKAPAKMPMKAMPKKGKMMDQDGDE